MTRREEIEKTIDKIETAAFLLKMKDYWDGDDYRMDREYSNSLRELKLELESLQD